MCAFVTLDDLESILQKSADFSSILSHNADKIDRQPNSERSKLLFMKLCSLRAPMRRFNFSTHHSSLTTSAGFCNCTQQHDNPAAASYEIRTQPATRAPSQPQLTTHIKDMTGLEVFRQLGSLDNSYKETPNSIRNNRTSPLNPFLHRSEKRNWTTQS